MADCLLSMTDDGMHGQGQAPWPRGFTNFDPLSATLFGLFTNINALHHYLGAMVPTAGVALDNIRLRKWVCACDTSVLGDLPW